MSPRSASGSIQIPPLVSVVVPAHNCARYLADSIQSVRAQDYPNWECVIIDDGSTDDTAAVIEGLVGERVRSLRQANLGVSGARNAGIRATAGDFVAFLDADDVWLPRKLSRQMHLLESRPDVGLVYSSYAMTDSRLRERVIVRPCRSKYPIRSWLLMEGPGIGLSFTGVVRREVIHQVGGFDTTLSMSADLEFAARVAAQYETAGVDDVLALYRLHPDQMHLDLALLEADVRRLLGRDLGIDSEQERRMSANLHTRLFFASVRAANLEAARSHLATAWSASPTRLVALPVRAGSRRLGRQIRSWARRAGGRALDVGAAYPGIAE